jgi:nucleoside-diphosphate-sugar epimerase
VHVLVSGANGYIGLRLIQALLDAGHEITAIIRDKRRFPLKHFGENETRLHLVEADFLETSGLQSLPHSMDAAYYLIHSMGSGGDFAAKEERCARNFSNAAKQLSFLGSGVAS